MVDAIGDGDDAAQRAKVLIFAIGMLLVFVYGIEILSDVCFGSKRFAEFQQLRKIYMYLRSNCQT